MGTIQCIHDLEVAKGIWESLTPDQLLYDCWDFRYCFHKEYSHPLRFYVSYDAERAVGLLPLVLNEAEGYVEFFGGSWMEANRVFTAPGYEDQIPLLYQAMEGEPRLYDIVGEDPYTASLPLGINNYYLPLQGLESHASYVESFTGKHKYNIRKSYKQIELRSPLLIFDRFSDLDFLIDYSIKTFPTESIFLSQRKQQVFRELLGLPYRWMMLSVEIDGQICAATLGVPHQGTYYFLLTGSDNQAYPGLGSFIYLQNVDLAIQAGCGSLDVGRHDCNWKERWHLSKVQMHDLAPNAPARD